MRSSPKSRDYLVALIEKEIAKQGLQADLNHLDVSRTENMDFLFVQWPDFNGDISRLTMRCSSSRFFTLSIVIEIYFLEFLREQGRIAMLMKQQRSGLKIR